MKISDYAVKNYQFTLVIFLMIIALGITTILNMPRAEDPELNPPQYPIVVVYPGTSPKDMEELVAEPLERKISELENIKQIKTTISDGVAVLFVEYQYDSDVDEKYSELVREVNALRGELPQNIASIEVRKVTPSDVNVVQIALVSENASREKLETYAEALRDQLEKIKQLKKVKIHGLPDRIVRVDLKLDKMAQMHLPLDAVIGSLQSEIANIPGGNVNAGTKSFNIKTSGNYANIDEIKKTIVYSSNNKNIMLGDIASIYTTYEEDTHITRLNGNRSLFITAAQKGDRLSGCYKPINPSTINPLNYKPLNLSTLLPFCRFPSFFPAKSRDSQAWQII